MRGDIYDKEGDPDSHMARIFLLLRKSFDYVKSHLVCKVFILKWKKLLISYWQHGIIDSIITLKSTYQVTAKDKF